ncbi:MAG: sensor histidine kinase, partial [Anaerolineae bacterium]|nr:sensor histidine kinase [Anaerolineae bacterium]
MRNRSSGIQLGRNALLLITHLLIVLGFTIATVLVLVLVAQVPSDRLVQRNDIIVPLIVGAVGALLIGAMTLIKPLRRYSFLSTIPINWVLAGVYAYFLGQTYPLLMAGILLTLISAGMLQLGPQLGAFHAVGVFIAVLVGIFIADNNQTQFLASNIEDYLLLAAFTLLVAIIASLWYNLLDEENNSNRKSVRQENEEYRQRLLEMRERAKAFSEMAATLNATLNYDRILDAAMNIGRLSIRHDAKQRVVGMALMVGDQGNLQIATARGLQPLDMHKTFPGQSGVIGQAMEDGSPVIIEGGDEDPELGKLNAFANIRTTLVIPLRAQFETYGVLVFGSTAPKAINEDHIDTLGAIGVQATIALRNSVLYANLQDEKERIIRIENNARKALVRDLHDIPTQTVSAVAMHLSTIPIIAERQPETLNDEVENIRQMALRATEEIRHVMFSLRPLSLESSGLETALAQLSDKMISTYKQPMQIDLDPQIERVLKPEAQGTVFYLIEEAANNSRKYAKASLIRVRGTIEGNEIVFRVQDNGEGFDTSDIFSDYSKRGSFGMVNMRERAELINGSFEIQSAPGKGTTVVVRVPLEDENLPDASRKPLIQPRRSLRKSRETAGQ